MMLDTFFEKFELFADAFNAVSKIRELILQLAMQGKLVKQDPRDESAEQLLDLIANERAINSRNLRAQHSNAVVERKTKEGNHAFQIPKSWVWTKLGSLALQIQYGYTASSDPTLTDIRMLRITDIQNNQVDWSLVPGCQIDAEEAQKYLLNQNDILIARTGGTIGKSFIVLDAPVKSVFASYLIRVTPPRSLVARYVKIFLESPLYWTQLRAMSAGTGQPNVNGQALGQLELPLPPLAEQKRIVKKVDELMTLCEQLEGQQQERTTKHAQLARAAVARFADMPTSANLNLMFHNSFTVSSTDLRKAILNLAVQGKLVPPNEGDKPVEDCFPKFAAAAESPQKVNFPPHWLQLPLGKVGEWRGGGTPSKSRLDFWEGEIPWVSPKDMKTLTISDTVDHISNAAIAESSAKLIPSGSLLMVVRGMILARAFPVALTAREVTINQDLKALLPFESGAKEFLLISLRAFEPQILQAVERSTHGTCKLLTAFLENFPIGIPPLAEQRRIVAKVDQLMALVDQLEAQLKESRSTAENLMEAIVAQLIAQE